MRLNVPLFVCAFVPWTVLAVAICAQRSGTPASLTDLVRDILPTSALTRWSASFPILAFTSGLLLAFALVEPRVQEPVRVRATVSDVVDENEAVEEVEERPVALSGHAGE
jgi:hypothetical protein